MRTPFSAASPPQIHRLAHIATKRSTLSMPAHMHPLVYVSYCDPRHPKRDLPAGKTSKFLLWPDSLRTGTLAVCSDTAVGIRDPRPPRSSLSKQNMPLRPWYQEWVLGVLEGCDSLLAVAERWERSRAPRRRRFHLSLQNLGVSLGSGVPGPGLPLTSFCSTSSLA